MSASPQQNEPSKKLPNIEIRAKVSTKGQVVIPIDIRRALGIEDGDHNEVIFRMEDGVLYLEVAEQDVLLSPEELVGLLDAPEDEGYFELDLQAAREDRVDVVLEKPMHPLAEESNE